MSEVSYKGLTVDVLRRHFDYDPDTGFITWALVSARQNAVGKRAGTIGTKGYRFVTLKGVKFAAHRLAWIIHYGEFPEDQLDHVNGNRDDNRILNLRKVSARQNNQNAIRHAGGSGIRNVVPSGFGAWVVRIWAGGKQHYLGTFKDIELAEFVAIEGRRSIHGEFMYEQR